jgi:hypothetical protein
VDRVSLTTRRGTNEDCFQLSLLITTEQLNTTSCYRVCLGDGFLLASDVLLCRWRNRGTQDDRSSQTNTTLCYYGSGFTESRMRHRRARQEWIFASFASSTFSFLPFIMPVKRGKMIRCTPNTEQMPWPGPAHSANASHPRARKRPVSRIRFLDASVVPLLCVLWFLYPIATPGPWKGCLHDKLMTQGDLKFKQCAMLASRLVWARDSSLSSADQESGTKKSTPSLVSNFLQRRLAVNEHIHYDS